MATATLAFPPKIADAVWDRWNRDNVDRPDVFTGFNVVSTITPLPSGAGFSPVTLNCSPL